MADELKVDLTPDQIKELQDKAAQADELQKTVEAKEAELAKLKNKDLNFAKLRDKTEEEKQEMLKKATDKERLVLEELNDLRKEREDERKARLQQAKDYMLDQEVGSDPVKRKELELKAAEWGELKTVEDVQKRYADAATLLRSSRPDVRPLNSYAPTSSFQEPPKPKAFVETPEGRATYLSMFPNSPLAKQQK
jgi:hypothetical protein